MSIKAMTKVFEAKLPDVQFRAMIAMADHADDEGGSIYPSVELLAWKIGKSERQTQRIVKALREAGYVELVRPARRTRPNEYKIVFAALPAKREFVRGLNTMPAGMREEVIEAGELKCAICGKRGSDTEGPDDRSWTVDRIVGAADGGRYEWGNVRLACWTCNNARNFRGGVDGTPEIDAAGRSGVPPVGTPGVPSTGTPGGATWKAPEPSKETSGEPTDEDCSVEQSSSSENEPTGVASFSSSVIELSHRLAEGIKRNDAKADVKPDSKGWLDPIRLLLDRDGRSVEEVGDVIDWCLADEFNRKTVLSPRALRKRFGELAQKAGVAQPDERPQNGRLAIAFRRGSARDAESLPAFIADATLEDTWAPIAADLREAVDESAFNIWLAPLHLHEAGEELVVGTGQGALSWVRDRFGRVIESCAESVAGKPVRLVSCECERAERAA